MENFTEYYFRESITSDIRRAFTSNLFKKTTEGINLKKYQKNLILSDNRNFDKIKNSLRQEVTHVLKVTKKFKKNNNKQDFGKLYVKNIYTGEIDAGQELLEGNPIATTIYKLNNGGKIIFITTEDEKGYVRRYITANHGGASFFRERLGTTLQQIAADSRGREVTRIRIIPAEREIQNLKTGVFQELETKPDEEESEDIPRKEIGIMDISVDDYENLIKLWGSGKKSDIKGGSVAFKGLFNRETYFHDETGYNGYKYSDKQGHTLYILDESDDKDAMIIFEGKSSYNWALKIGMLSFWTTNDKKYSVVWKDGTIHDFN